MAQDIKGLPAPADLRSAFALVTSNIVLVSAVLYLVGWVYLYYFFQAFGIGITQVGVGWTDAIVYSPSVFRQLVTIRLLTWLSGATAAVLFATALCRHYSTPIATKWTEWRASRPKAALLYDRINRFARVLIDTTPRGLVLLFAGLIAIAVVNVVIDLSRVAGLGRANVVRNSPGDGVKITLKETCKASLDDVVAHNNSGALRRLYATDKWHFFFIQDGTWDPDQTAIDWVTIVQIPTDCIIGISGQVRPFQTNG